MSNRIINKKSITREIKKMDKKLMIICGEGYRGTVVNFDGKFFSVLDEFDGSVEKISINDIEEKKMTLVIE
jgi:hypothetical protein